jgi:diguanylate cyclase (GGDEF)-like protein/PAS domain S-box-containing protein
VLASVLETTSDLIAVIDPDGNVLFANPATCAACGVAPGEPVTLSHFRHLATEETWHAFRTQVLSTVLDKGMWSGDFTMVIGGRIVPASGVMNAHFAPAGDVEYYSIIVRDISDLKAVEDQLKASEAWHRHLVQHGMDIATVHGPDGSIVYASPSIERVFGIAPDDLLGEVTEWTDRVHPDDVPITLAAREQVLSAPGATCALDACRFLHADGSYRWLEVRFTNLLDDPVVNGILTNARDITDRREAEAATERSDALVRAVALGSPLAIFTIDEHGTTQLWNAACERLFGWSAKAAIGGALPFVDDDHRDEFDELRRRVFTGEMLHGVDVRWCHQDGHDLDLVLSAAPIADATGRVMTAIGLVADVTERRRAEAALETSEARFRALVQHATDIVTVLDGEGVVRYTSPATERLLGYRVDDVVNRNAFEFVHEDDALRAREALLETLVEPGAKSPIELRIKHADGSIREFEVVANNLLENPAVAGVVLNARDVTERKAADEARRLSEVRFTTLVEKAADLVSVLDVDGNLKYTAPSAVRLFGSYGESGVGRSHFDIVHPDDRDAVARVFSEVVSTPGPGPSVRFRARKSDGSWLWLDASATNLLHEPAVNGIVVAARDITRQHEAETELARREAHFRALLQNLSDAVVVVAFDDNGPVAKWTSPAVERVLGYPVRRQLAMGEELIHPDDREQVAEGFSGLFTGDTVPPVEFRARHADGTWRWLETLVKDLRDDPIVGGVVFTTRDVTAQHEAAAAVERRLVFEDLLGKISSRFVNLPDAEQDVGIDEALRDVAEFTGADRAYVFLRSEAGVLDNTHEWCAPGIDSSGAVRQNLRRDDFPWSRDYIENQVVLEIPRVDALGDEAAAERELLQRVGCKSVLAVPLVSGDRPRGTVGLDAVRAPMDWADDHVRLLEAVGGLFLGALARSDAQAALRGSQERYRAIVEDQTDLICRYRPDGVLTFVNEAYARHHGRQARELIGSSFLDLVPDHHRPVAEASMSALTPERPVQSYTYRTTGPDRTVRWHEWTERALFAGDELLEFQAVARDVTEQREAELLVADQARILEMIATGARLPRTLTEICRLVESHAPDERCSVLLVNRAGTALVHGAAHSLPAEFVRAVNNTPIGPNNGSCGAAAARGEPVVSLDIATDPEWEGRRDLALAHGLRSSWSVPIRSSSGQEILGTFAMYHDSPRRPSLHDQQIVDIAVQVAAIAIERRAAEERLGYQAHHDHLTGLPNRVLLSEFLGLALARSRRRGTTTGVLFLDVDRFKLVNDTLGHDAGDELLVALAERLRTATRPGDVVARFGGDEFVVIAEELAANHADHQAVGLAHRILASVREPFMVNDEEQYLTASIGIALAGPGHDRGETLLRDADAAMYQAKEQGRGRAEIFDETLQRRVRERRDIGNALHRAIERNEFQVLYQPIVSLVDGRCVGVEALLRWAHPERGVLEPDDFLEIAEETGLIVPIGSWVLDAVCRQAAEWQASQADDAPFVVSLNLSARQLNRSGLVENVARTFRETGVDPARICFEITESVLMATAQTTIQAVGGLAELGARLSIDDFGTGYSSLEYLKRLRADSIKVDRSFVEGLGVETEDQAIIAAVVSLGHALDLRVVAEGVNTEAQLGELVRLGCDAAQGYLFSAPEPAERLATVAARPATPALPGLDLLTR